MASDSLIVTINLDILPPATIVDIANALLHEINELHGNHNENAVVIKARTMHRAIIKYLSEAHGDPWLDGIQS